MSSKGWGNTKPRTGNNNKKRINEEIDVYQFPDGEWVTMRLFGPIRSYVHVWFDIIGSKSGKKVSIPKLASNYDYTTEEFKGPCPYVDSGLGRIGQRYLGEAIIRELQENKPAKLAELRPSEKRRRVMIDGEWRVKEPGSRSWTPVRAVDFPASLVEKLKDLVPLNKVKKKDGKVKTYDISDERYGCDLMIMFNSKASGPDKWRVNKSDRTPMSEEELDYLVQPLDELEALTPDSPSEMKAELAKIKENMAPRESDDINDSGRSSNKRGDKAKGRSRDDDDDDDDDDDEDEPRRPSRDDDRGSRVVKSNKSGKRDDGRSKKDDKRGSKKGGKERSSSSSSRDEDDDDIADFDDDDL